MNSETDIQKFYCNKNVFITGGTGFLGKVYIEKLLRSTKVNNIYMLIRPKKGKDIYERIENIFKDPLFDKLLQLKPNASKHIVPICGDCTVSGLGLSEQDLAILLQNIDIVIHSAATVRFTESLSVALAINVRATLDLLEIAKQMKRLKVFLHVSSAFANCTQPFIDERFYTDAIGISADQICEMSKLLGPNFIDNICDKLLGKFPNTYCFTKALAEEAVLAHGSTLPICIFRPGVVIPTSKEPVSGWTDNFYGPISILYGAGCGVLRVIYGNVNWDATIVPVDFCANMMIACIWHTSSKRIINYSSNVTSPASPTPPASPVIYNFVPHEKNLVKWDNFRRAVEVHGVKMPLTKMLWYPFVIITHSNVLYTILCFLYHTIPGYIFDFILLLQGRKRRMVKLYKKIHYQTSLLKYFADHNWSWGMENTKHLWKDMSAADQELYHFNMISLDWWQYFYDSLVGMRRFLAKEEPDTIPKGLIRYKRLLYLHRALQFVIYGGGSGLVLWSIFH